MSEGAIKAVLGPTNTGKTYLAVERLCAHSSGAIGFPLRLLAREVYDRVCKIKGADRVALITGEERIEPPGARWRLCTVEAMDRDADLAFVAIDEAQLGADRERGHVFTDRLLNARGRDETMILGAATLAPMVAALEPKVEIISRPRFSTLSHVGAQKLSRIPPRSAIVAFSADQVYQVAEMLRRFRGGAAVVMGALSPHTRNAQVAMFQSGEVDYLVATDAIGMGLNLDVGHVAFAGLSKFDGVRQRRLTPAEMAQIAGRAGRHQRDGTFGMLAGGKGSDFTEDEIHAIEEHRFAPLSSLYWREARPRFDSLATLISDLEAPPGSPVLQAAPEAIDLSVAKLLAADPEISANVRGRATVARFWEACSLPDFRQLGSDSHARFVARLWRDLSEGNGWLPTDYVARKIAELDQPSGDIDTLQGRIAAIRSWSYIAQRPDWVLAREEMAERAWAVEVRLSDALHARLTERFVNRRTAVLMRKIGNDAGLLPVEIDADDEVLVDGEAIGTLDGFAFRVDSDARHETRRLLLAAAERHLPRLLARRGEALHADLEARGGDVTWNGESIAWRGHTVAQLTKGRRLLAPQLRLDRALSTLPDPLRQKLDAATRGWLEDAIATALGPLLRIDAAASDLAGGPDLRALLLALVEAGGVVSRASSNLDCLDDRQRALLRRLKVQVGNLDLFVPALLRPLPQRRWAELARLFGMQPRPAADPMPPALPARGATPAGYRRAGRQFVRADMAEKLLRQAHELRQRATSGGSRTKGRAPFSRRFALDPALALSMGLTLDSYRQLLRQAGFDAIVPRALPDGAHGPPAPVRWRWRPHRVRTGGERPQRLPTGDNPFAALAALVR